MDQFGEKEKEFHTTIRVRQIVVFGFMQYDFFFFDIFRVKRAITDKILDIRRRKPTIIDCKSNVPTVDNKSLNLA